MPCLGFVAVSHGILRSTSSTVLTRSVDCALCVTAVRDCVTARCVSLLCVIVCCVCGAGARGVLLLCVTVCCVWAPLCGVPAAMTCVCQEAVPINGVVPGDIRASDWRYGPRVPTARSTTRCCAVPCWCTRCSAVVRDCALCVGGGVRCARSGDVRVSRGRADER